VAAGAFAADPAAQPKAPPKAAPKKKAPPKPTIAQLSRQLAELKALIDAQQQLIEEQAATMAAQQTKIDADAARLAALEQQLDLLKVQLQALQQQIPGAEEQAKIEERLKKIEAENSETPEIPPGVITAGDFPGSIRIPGTDAAIKFGGRIRAAAVFTLAPLGTDDKFQTNSIPVEPTDAAAGEGARTNFSANTSRISFEMRTPVGKVQVRTYIEGDFYGSNAVDANINFRLRHAYAQFKGFLVGQTWSTFADPANIPLDMDFEGINGECNVRQSQIRYTAQIRDDLSIAGALEDPAVSITGGEGVNVAPDAVFRTIWTFDKTGHIQSAVVLRDIRGEADAPSTAAGSVFGWGLELSGVVPIPLKKLEDRFVFQWNFGKGIARYINDLQSLGGQDAVFNPLDGSLHALPAVGFYLDYEHTWKRWKMTREMNLRTAVTWSFVDVHNLTFQTGSAYQQTNRYSVNIVFSPVERIDLGVEYLYGTRRNFDGHTGSADQIQLVGIFRF
jgi:hypothetical protein